jgi:hypothetical protein
MACLDIEPLYELPSEDRALPESERAVVATAIEEIAPAVATMLTVAIERRLPWWSSSEEADSKRQAARLACQGDTLTVARRSLNI